MVMNTSNESQALQICLAVDELYFHGAYITCFSILKNISINFVPTFHIILSERRSDFEGKIISKLRKLKKRFDIRFYEIDEGQFQNFPNFFFSSKMIYARLLIPEILKVDYVIYVDCDILVMKDISTADLEFAEDQWCKGAVDVTTKTLRGEILETKFSGLNFAAAALNSGFLLLNLDRLRENGKFRDAFNYLAQSGNALRNHDQSAINVVLNGDFEHLSRDWNYMVNYYPDNMEQIIADECRVNFHFVTSQKPWLVTKPTLPFFLFYEYCKECDILYELQLSSVNIWVCRLFYKNMIIARLYYTFRMYFAAWSKNERDLERLNATLSLLTKLRRVRSMEKNFLREVKI